MNIYACVLMLATVLEGCRCSSSLHSVHIPHLTIVPSSSVIVSSATAFASGMPLFSNSTATTTLPTNNYSPSSSVIVSSATSYASGLPFFSKSTATTTLPTINYSPSANSTIQTGAALNISSSPSTSANDLSYSAPSTNAVYVTAGIPTTSPAFVSNQRSQPLPTISASSTTNLISRSTIPPTFTSDVLTDSTKVGSSTFTTVTASTSTGESIVSSFRITESSIDNSADNTGPFTVSPTPSISNSVQHSSNSSVVSMAIIISETSLTNRSMLITNAVLNETETNISPTSTFADSSLENTLTTASTYSLSEGSSRSTLTAYTLESTLTTYLPSEFHFNTTSMRNVDSSSVYTDITDINSSPASSSTTNVTSFIQVSSVHPSLHIEVFKSESLDMSDSSMDVYGTTNLHYLQSSFTFGYTSGSNVLTQRVTIEPNSRRTEQDVSTTLVNMNTTATSITAVHDSKTKNPTIYSPSILQNKIVVRMTFDGNCNILTEHQFLRFEFSKRLLEELRAALNVTPSQFEIEQLTCSPMIVQFRLKDLQNEQIQPIVLVLEDLSERNQNFSVHVQNDATILTYRLNDIQFGVETEDLSIRDIDYMATKLQTADYAILSVASFMVALLVTVALIYVCRQCYSRKRVASFTLKELPHVNIKMADFTLIKIPRPKMIYHDKIRRNGSKEVDKSRYNGHQPEIPRIRDPPKRRAPTVSAQDIRVRMSAHEDGLVVGITSYNDSQTSPKYEQSGNESSENLIRMSSESSSVGMTNQGYVVDDETFNENGEVKSELELML